MNLLVHGEKIEPSLNFVATFSHELWSIILTPVIYLRIVTVRDPHNILLNLPIILSGNSFFNQLLFSNLFPKIF